MACQDGPLADDSKNNDVGGRYAQALFELALQADALSAVEGDLKALKAAYGESADLRRLLQSPAFNAEDKAKGLEVVAHSGGAHALTRKFLGLLARNRRASALPAVADAFARLAAKHRGTVSAEVVTAAPLTDAQREQITGALRQALGRDPEIETRVDPALLGGLRVKVGSRLFDASLKTRLDQMKFALKRA